MSTVTHYTLRRVEPADRPVVAPLLAREWGSTKVVALALGGSVDAAELPGWLAYQDGSVVGLLTYLVNGDKAELVTINAFVGGGVGAALVRALVDEVRGTGVTRIGVTTTNDNTRALRFYQRVGFRFRALHVGAMAQARKLKPEIPELGLDDISIRDELELELVIE